MNSRPSSHRRSADQDAGEWFVRLLEDELEPAELEAWNEWIREPEHRAAYDRVADAWALGGLSSIGRPTASQVASDQYDGAVTIADWRSRRRLGRVLLRCAAAVAMAVGLAGGAWYWWEWSGAQPAQRIATVRAEHKDAVLSDGSGVRLAAMTELEVKYRRGRRAIGMERGEALFEVAPDKSRPFVVETPAGDIRALGTAFDVRVSDSDLTLVVTEGVVRFEPARRQGEGRGALEGEVRIFAGQTLVLDRWGARLSRAPGQVALQPAWLQGRLEYRDEALSVVLEDVNRYAPAPIVIADPAIGGFHYTGSIKLDSIEAWAASLSVAFPLRVEEEPGRLLLKKKAQEQLPNRVAQAS